MTRECITFAETPFSFYDGGVGKHLLAMILGGGGGAVRGNTYAGGERYSIQNLVCIYCLDNINIYKAS